MQDGEPWRTIEQVRAEALVCVRCDLAGTRRNVVFGEGPTPSRLMIVGEGPGAEEDVQGRPFVGRAGKVLSRVLSQAGIDRSCIWLTNTVRCRPVTLRDGVLRNCAPRRDEIAACDVWMSEEYRFISPEVVVCLGSTPARALISKDFRLTKERGQWYLGKAGIPTIATYHPSYISRFGGTSGEMESLMVDDLRKAVEKLGMG